MIELMKLLQSLEQLAVGTTLLDARGIRWNDGDGKPLPQGHFHKLLILDSQIFKSVVVGESYICCLTVLNGKNGFVETRTVFGGGIANYRIL